MSTKVPAVRPRDTRRSGPKYAGSTMRPPRKWTADEDELLRRAVQEIGAKHWKVVAERVPGRNHVQCLQRYLRVLQPGLKKGHWTPEEDDKLRVLATHGFTSWIEAAQQIPGRSAKQCRDRWRNHLEASIKHTPWEPEEDALLLELHAKHGNRWAAIARCLPGRTENAVKIHCKSLLARKAALMDGSTSLNHVFDTSFDLRDNGEEGEAQTSLHRNLDEEDAEETTDDLSSISPLPSPMGFPAQWMRPWSSTTPTASVHRGNPHFTLAAGAYTHSTVSSQQQGQQCNQPANGLLRATRLQSFPPPPMIPSNLVMRRSSFPAAQQLPAAPLSNPTTTSHHRHSLFPPIDTSASLLFDPSPLLEHIPSPINSPSSSSFATSPANLNNGIPLNLRMELPLSNIMRAPTTSEGFHDRFFMPGDS